MGDRPAGSSNEKAWEELPKSRVIIVRKWVQSSDSVILRSIDTDLEFPPNCQTTTGIYVMAMTTDGFLKIYCETRRENQSPWKGMHSYIPGKPLLRIPFTNQPTIVSIFRKLSTDPKNIEKNGLTIFYKISEQTGKITFTFNLDNSRIFDTLEEAVPNFHSSFQSRSQSVLEAILSENAQLEPVVGEEQTRRNNLDFAKFFLLFRMYKEKNKEEVPKYLLKSDHLTCQLMSYQKETVRWMIHRENAACSDPKSAWMRSEVLSSNSLIYYPTLGVVCRQNVRNEEKFRKRFTLKGGILADEMGLGKTIQVLSLITAHRRNEKLEVVEDDQEESDRMEMGEQGVSNLEVAEQIRIAEASHAELTAAKTNQQGVCYSMPDSSSGSVQCYICSQVCSASVCGWKLEEKGPEDQFTCPECLTKSGIRKSVRTTLVILPESLIFQWFTEIAKHCSDRIRVMFYFGVKKHGYLPASEMEKYDVILTTYDTLRAETIFSESAGSERNLRNGHKQLFLTSSLIHVKFWRVIVDESQMMPNGITSQLSKMLFRIEADNWWCVTGTPLVKSVTDIQSLFSFLDVLPLSNQLFFSQVAHPQYLKLAASEQLEVLPENLLLETLALWMSRKTKQQVAKQLAIPELVEIEKTIQFSAIEERQYKQEKETLRKRVEQMLERTPSTALLSTHPYRDRVLQQLKTLREIILTGHTNKGRPGSELGSSGFVYASETIIFRLVRAKKMDIQNSFRMFMSSSLGLAGVCRLEETWNGAMDAYKMAADAYKEILEAEKYIETTIGMEAIGKLVGNVEEVEELSDDDDDDEDHANRAMKVSGLMRSVHMILRKFEKKDEVKEEIDEEEEEPVIKKPKLEVDEQVEDNSLTTDEKEYAERIEKEKREREKYSRRQAQIALKPMRMDVTQHVHLTLAMHSMRNVIEGCDVMEDASLIADIGRFYQVELEAIQTLHTRLPVLNSIWGNAMEQMRGFFETMTIRSEKMSDTSALYKKSGTLGGVNTVNPHVLQTLLPMLPFLALYDDAKEPCISYRHCSQVCMGSCSDWHISCLQMANVNSCLPLAKIIQKAWDHMRRLDEDRERLDRNLHATMDLLTEMSEPKTLLDFLREKNNPNEQQKRMWKMIGCKHVIINGSEWKRREILVKRADVDNYCEICSLMYYCTKLDFDAGFVSFHGSGRYKSGVLHFIAYLVEHYAAGRQEGKVFMRTTIRPFFGKLDETLKVYERSVLIMLEVLDRFEELFQASCLLTDEQVLPQKTSEQRQIDIETLRNARLTFQHSQIGQRNETRKEFQKDLGELRYLVNLMKQQMNGEEDMEECPICQLSIESFMVFTCGHRVCTGCFEALKNMNRREVFNAHLQAGTVVCPTCRVKNQTKQVMIAKSGHADKDHLIPGVVLSAKMSCAIVLMREIIAADSANKIILFTSVDTSSSMVWNYLLKILKLAKLPFSQMTRSAYGKRVVDFEVSSDVKVLLCSLSLCANGLNMTGANHIIFLDPPHLRPVLQQAIGRINRFGQTRAMKVFHLCVEGSLDVELRATAKKVYNRNEEQNGWTVGDIRGMFGIPQLSNIEREENVMEPVMAQNGANVWLEQRRIPADDLRLR